MGKSGGGRFADIFKVSAASSAGLMVGIIPQLLIGVVILLLGIYLLSLDKKSNKGTNNHGFKFYLGIVLIILGSVISLNMGFDIDMVMYQIF